MEAGGLLMLLRAAYLDFHSDLPGWREQKQRIIIIIIIIISSSSSSSIIICEGFAPRLQEELNSRNRISESVSPPKLRRARCWFFLSRAGIALCSDSEELPCSTLEPKSADIQAPIKHDRTPGMKAAREYPRIYRLTL